MISQLYIRNYALIEELKIGFSSNMNVITGETGAGKSILLGALGLSLGKRADTSVLKDKEQKCVVEAIFALNASDFKEFFEENDLDFHKETILRREILPSSRSRAFVNDTPIDLQTLSKLSSKLVDVSSQNDSLLLKNQDFLLNMLDALAGNIDTSRDYKNKLISLKALQAELKNFLQEKADLHKERDYILFQFEELEALNLDGSNTNEQNDLESELNLLENVDGLKTSLDFSVQVLRDNQDNAQTLISKAIESLSSFKNNTKINKLVERLSALNIEFHELCFDIDHYQNEIEADPERLEQLQNRLSDIYRLLRKHSVDSVSDLILIKQEFELKLNNLEFSEEKTAALEDSIEKQNQACHKIALKLSKGRKQQATLLSKQIVNSLKELGMPGVSVEFTIDSNKETLTERGFDHLEVMFSANPGSETKSLHKAASGGELSRVMLALKANIAGRFKLPTLIFDEIDSGVSGDIAGKTAKLLKNIASEHQLICITHLPQIAAAGSSHYFVSKSLGTSSAKTNLRLLNNDERIREIAQMMSAESSTDAALKHAEELIKASK